MSTFYSGLCPNLTIVNVRILVFWISVSELEKGQCQFFQNKYPHSRAQTIPHWISDHKHTVVLKLEIESKQTKACFDVLLDLPLRFRLLS